MTYNDMQQSYRELLQRLLAVTPEVETPPLDPYHQNGDAT